MTVGSERRCLYDRLHSVVEFSHGECRADRPRRKQRRAGRLCALAESHPDVDLLHLLRRERTDSGKAIAVDSNGKIWIAGDTQSTDLPNTGGFPGLADRHAEYVRRGLRSVANRHRDRNLFHLHRRHALGRSLWHRGGAGWNAFGWLAARIRPTSGSRESTIRAFMAATAMPTSLTSILHWARTLCSMRASWAATELMRQPAWCWIRPGAIIVSGYTLSPNFPVTSTCVPNQLRGRHGCLCQRFGHRRNRQLVYSTYFGGSGPDAAMDLKEDSSGILYLCGYTESAGLPSTATRCRPITTAAWTPSA